MKTRRFTFWHSLAGTLVLLVLEFLATRFLPGIDLVIGIILAIAAIGSVVTIYVSTEIIEEVRGASHMILFLSAVMIQFVIFFAFQYLFLGIIQPASFPTLLLDPSSLLLHSIMVFVFNPLYLPATSAGRELLLVQTFAALALVMFLFQNITEFRRKSLDKNKSVA